MKLQDGYTNLEWSKKLKALGVRQESAFYLVDGGKDYGWKLDRRPEAWVSKGGKLENYWNDYYSAFTVAELGVALPDSFSSMKTGLPDQWRCEDDLEQRPNGPIVFERTEANTRAAMLCYLLENKIITVEEVNARLAA